MDTSSVWPSLVKANIVILGLFAFGVYLVVISDKTFTPYAHRKFSKETLNKMKIGARILFIVMTIAFFITFVPSNDMFPYAFINAFIMAAKKDDVLQA